MEEKKKMLFIDDRTKRLMTALKKYSDEYDLTLAANVPEALRQLSAQKWDVVSVDHDLSGYDFEDPATKECGMEIVRYIQRTGWPFHYEPTWIVHSSNAFAAHLLTVELKKLFRDVRQVRFSYEVEHMQYDKEGLPIK